MINSGARIRTSSGGMERVRSSPKQRMEIERKTKAQRVPSRGCEGGGEGEGIGRGCGGGV